MRHGAEPVAARRVDEVEVVVAAPLGRLQDGERRAVGRKAGDFAPASVGEDDALLAGVELADDHVPVDAVASVRRVCEQAPVAARARRAMEERGVDDEGLECRTRPGVEDMELSELVPGVVHLHEHALALRQKEPRDGLGQVRELDELAARERPQVELRRAAEVGGDERNRAVRREISRRGGAHFEQVVEIRHGRSA